MKVKGRKIASVLLAVAIAMVSITIAPYTAQAAGGVQRKINEIRALFPDGTYFSADGKACSSQASPHGCSNCQLSNVLKSRYPAFANKGLVDGQSCVAFARFVYYYLFGVDSYYVKTNSTNVSLANAKIGDFVYVNGTAHVGIYARHTSTHVYLFDANNGYSGYSPKSNRVKYEVAVPRSSNTFAVYHSKNYDVIDNDTTTPQPVSPTVTTTDAKNISETNATLYGKITKQKGVNLSSCGINFGTSSTNLTRLTNEAVSSGVNNANNGTGFEMWYDLNKWGKTLSKGTTYYWQAYAICNGTEYKGAVKSFKTGGTSPTPTPIPTPAHVPVTAVTLSKTFMTLEVGQSEQIIAWVSPANATNKDATSISSNSSIATADKGIVTGVKAGTTTVTVKTVDGGKTASMTVTVKAKSSTSTATPATPPPTTPPSSDWGQSNINSDQTTPTAVPPTSTPEPTPTPPPATTPAPSLNGWHKGDDGNWYFYSNNNRATGWHRDGSNWYYLARNTGAMQTGWIMDGSSWYYLKSSGAMATGWQRIGGYWYYLKSSGSMQTGWLQSGGSWYYLKSSGSMVTGWQQIGGTWYWFDGGGCMATGARAIGSTVYYFNSSGAWIN